jgi:hypothetical protein
MSFSVGLPVTAEAIYRQQKLPRSSVKARRLGSILYAFCAAYIFSLALRVIACPVADMSFPAPDVVLQALSREAAPASSRRLTSVIARFLRIGDSFDIRRVVEADELQHCRNIGQCLYNMDNDVCFTTISHYLIYVIYGK